MRAALTIAAIFVAWAGLAAGFSAWDPVAADYLVFWRGARMANPYIQNIFPYPPSSLILWRPLAFLPLIPSYVALWLVSIPAFYIAARQHFDRATVAMALASASAIEGLVVGQFAMLFAAAILWAFSLTGIRRGLVLGVVVCIKPQLLLMAPLAFLVRRDWATLTGMAASALAMLVCSLLFGVNLWVDWFNSLDEFYDFLVVNQTTHRVFTPAGVADNFMLTAWPFLALGLGIGSAVTIAMARRVDGGLLAGAVVGLSPLAAPYALPHDTLSAVPIACLLLRREKVDWLVIPAILYFAGQYLLIATLCFAVWVLWRRIAPRLFRAPADKANERL